MRKWERKRERGEKVGKRKRERGGVSGKKPEKTGFCVFILISGRLLIMNRH